MAKNNTNIQPYIPWWIWFIIAICIAALGSFLMTTAVKTNMALINNGWGPIYNWPQYYTGLAILISSVIFDILALKSLITEAHVKALEVFYGKKRTVEWVNNTTDFE